MTLLCRSGRPLGSASLLCALTALMSLYAVNASAQATVDSTPPYDAVRALRAMESRVSSILGIHRLFTPVRFGPYGVCEIPVADYCYGPRNGKMSFGGYGTSVANRRLVGRSVDRWHQQFLMRELEAYREVLLKTARVTPDDRWIMSELVRTDVNGANLSRAMQHAMECTLERWWCEILRGYVSHIAGAWERADSIWSLAVTHMPLVERCAWLDPTWVANDDRFNAEYRALDCEERIRVAKRIWWLSDPLYSAPGNERLSEHFARLVDLILVEGAARRDKMIPAMLRAGTQPLHPDSSMLSLLNPKVMLSRAPWALSFPHGYTEVVMRLGPPYYLAPTDSADGRIVVQFPFPRVSFVPAASIFLSHLSATADDWEHTSERPFEFMTGWRGNMYNAEFQLAWFKRGDSALVVAASDIRGVPDFRPPRPAPVLHLQQDFDAPATSTTAIANWSGNDTWRFAMVAQPESTLVSIEFPAVRGSHARVRTATGPPPVASGRVTLSDILLCDPDIRDEVIFTKAAQEAHGGTKIRVRTRAMGLYWEVYGLEQGESPLITVTITRQADGGVGGFVRGIFSGNQTSSISTEWTDAPALGGGPAAKYLSLDIRTLTVGNYILDVKVSLPGQSAVVSSRRFEIVR